MTADIHALVEDTDDIDGLSSSGIDDEMRPATKAEITCLEANKRPTFPIPSREVIEGNHDLCVVSVRLIP
jgi:hypothetical protein